MFYRSIIVIIMSLVCLSCKDGTTSLDLWRQASWSAAWDGDEGKARTSPVSAWQAVSYVESLPKRPSQASVLWLRTRLPELTWRDPVLVADRVRYKMEVFLQGRLIYSFGHMTDRTERQFLGLPTHVIPLGRDFGRQELVIKIASDSPHIGITGGLRLGERSDIILDKVARDIPMFALACFCLAMALILLFVSRFPNVVYSHSLTAMCLCFAVSALCRLEVRYLLWDWARIWDYMQVANAYLIPVGFSYYWRYLSPRFARQKIYLRRYAITSLLLTFILDATRLVELTYSFYWLIFSLVAGGVVTVYLTYRDTAQGLPPVVMYGMGLLVAAGGHDILGFQRLLPWDQPLSEWVFFACLLALSRLYYRDLAEQMHTKASLEKEMETAAVFQRQFLQLDAPQLTEVSMQAFNRPAAHIGGDWFFQQLVDNRWLHVHLADVTGHGAGAALAATYAKGILAALYRDTDMAKAEGLVMAHERLNELLLQLNKEDSLLTMSMLSVALDLRDKKLFMVNSGHVAPMLWRHGEEEAARFLLSRNTSILGMSSEFSCRQPQELALTGDEFILLYSDGLVDVLRKYGQKSYQGAMRQMLKTYQIDAMPRLAKALDELMAADSGHVAERDDVTLVAIQLHATLQQQLSVAR